MKKCKIGTFATIGTLLLFLLLILPMTAGCLYELIFDQSLSSEYRMLFLAAAVVFGAFAVPVTYRLFCLGPSWVEYNSEAVIFHYSRREQHRFRWKNVPGDRIQVGWDCGYLFLIRLANGTERKFPVNRFSKVFQDFEKTLESVGVLKRAGIMTTEDLKKSAEQLFGQFEQYKQSSPDPVKPKPDGDCVLCPDCKGKGAFVKRNSVMKLDVVKVCKTCGGSGYVPR